MINKISDSVRDVVAQVTSGASIAVGGFGKAGVPESLIAEICARDLRDLHIISNNGGMSDDSKVGTGRLVMEGRVRKLTCSFPSSPEFFRLFHDGDIELELVPQGTLAERLRAGGAGIGAFYTPTGAGTDLSAGTFPIGYRPDGQGPIFPEAKETRVINGRPQVLEFGLKPMFAFVKAEVADRFGNTRFRLSARNFNPVCGMAGAVTIVEARTLSIASPIPPDDIHLPGIFVNAVVASNTT